MEKKRDVTGLHKVVKFAKHEEKVAVAEQGRTCLLDEEVLSLGKRDNEIGVDAHYGNHERQWWENTEESAFEEPAERNSPRRSLFIDHGETNNKTRHHEEHVNANKTTAEHSDLQVAKHHQRDRDCTQELNFLTYAVLRIHRNIVVEPLVTQRAAEQQAHAHLPLALRHIHEWKVWTTTQFAHGLNLVH